MSHDAVQLRIVRKAPMATDLKPSGPEISTISGEREVSTNSKLSK